MRALTLADLKLGLANLLDGQSRDLTMSAMGRAYGQLLAQRREEIEKLPQALTDGLPLSAELAHTDGVHDGLGIAIWHLCTAYMEHPRVPFEIQEAAARCREALVPSPGVLRRSYADEAKAALERRSAIAAMEADLTAIPVAGGKTLLDWANAYVDQGERLHALLQARADALGTIDQSARRRASQLRASTIDLLERFRAALAEELESDPSLPRDLDARLFGFFDKLASRRAR